MDNRNDGRECENNDADELERMNRRNCTQGETNPCHHRKNDRFAEALEEAFNEGYKQGYCEGYEEGYEKGYCEGYKEGCRDGYEKAKQEVLDFMKRKNRCCCKCC